jgi:hypothetical protein
MKKVFLGGTCNGSQWRADLIKKLKIEYFDPVVDDWTPEAQEEEIRQRESCDFCLYVITPKMTGVYSIAEAVDDSNKRPEKTVFCFLEKDGDKEFEAHQIKSLRQVGKMIDQNGGVWCNDLETVSFFLNGAKIQE